MRVGLIYDLFDDYPWREGEPFDADVENEPIETIEALEAAVRALGHEPVRVGPARRLAEMLFGGDGHTISRGALGSRLGADGRGGAGGAAGADGGNGAGGASSADGLRKEPAPFDVAINIAEGAHHRGREGEAPTLLEMAGIPYIGSDALTLSLSLDKAWTKDLAVQAGVQTPPYWIGRQDGIIVRGGAMGCGQYRAIGCAEDPNAVPGPYPLFVKPRYEGSAKGITAGSKVGAASDLRECVRKMTREYDQDVLIEPFIDGGGEFTVAVVGHAPARTLPAIQRAVDAETGIGVHVLDRKGLPGSEDWILPGSLTPALERRLAADALAVFHKLECKDFARVDFRVDKHGETWFLEINPLPTFAPDGTFAIMAELCGQSYTQFLGDVLGEALERVALGGSGHGAVVEARPVGAQAQTEGHATADESGAVVKARP